MKVNIHNLLGSPQFSEKLKTLVSKHFTAGHKCSRSVEVQEEFPILLSPENAHRNFFLEENGDIIATASWAPFEFHYNNSAITCAGIGLIVTSPDHRRKGLASKLIEYCENDARQKACSVAVLWSSLHEFYMRRGYMVAGSELQWKVPKSKLLLINMQQRVQALKNYSEISKIYENAAIGPKRNETRYQKFMNLPDTFAFKTDRSYVLMGKARDLHDVIHEINGLVDETPALLKSCAEKCEGQDIFIQLPSQSPFAPSITQIAGTPNRGAFALFKLLNGPSFVEKLVRASQIPNDVEFLITPKSFSIKHKTQNLFESEDFGHFMQLFMGPIDVDDFEDIPKSLKETLRKIKVPPLYFWGFDSV